MGVMDKFLNAMQLNNGELDDDFDDDYEEPVSTGSSFIPSKVQETTNDDDKKSFVSKVTPLPRKPRNIENGMEVCVFKPTSMDESREITETLLANRTVFLNLEGLDVDIAQRIIDFTSGATYALRGNLQKLSNYIFILTPASVDVSGDFQEMIDGNFDVPF